MTPRCALLVLALIAPTALAFPAPEPAAPAFPHRIVSVVPAVTEMLFAIGAGDDVVGVSSFDHYPPAVETRPRVGALLDPDFERVLSLKPDLVVVYGTQGDFIDRLRRAGIAMFMYEHAGLADIATTVQRLGEVVGRQAEAARVVDRIRGDLADVHRRVAAMPRVRTLLVFEREPGSIRGLYVSGGVGFMNDILDIAGGENVFADVKRENLQASTEVVIARAPDAVVEIHAVDDWSPSKVQEELRVWRTLTSLPAVRTNRVFILTGFLMASPGPRIAEAARILAKTLHPAAF